MEYFLLLLSLIFSSSQTITTKQYNIKAKIPNPFLYSGISALTALIFFIISSGFNLKFNIQLLPYSLGFAASYTAALVCSNLAIANGPLAITSLISSYSLLVPTFYGIFFLKDQMSVISYLGILLILISLFLINIKKDDRKFSQLWLIYIVVSFFGNGMCSVTQKMQQMKFSGNYKSEFMIMALIIVSVSLISFSVFKQKQLKTAIKDCLVFAPLTGVANGIVNLLVLILTGKFPNSFLFPMISAGGILIMFVVAQTVYKERFSPLQYLGYFLGLISVILLNI